VAPSRHDSEMSRMQVLKQSKRAERRIDLTVAARLRRFVPFLAAAAMLNSCQTVMDQSYQPSVSPSANPQIVSEVQKNDPRAQMGAREHPRILASYGGEYKDAKTESGKADSAKPDAKTEAKTDTKNDAKTAADDEGGSGRSGAGPGSVPEPRGQPRGS